MAKYGQQQSSGGLLGGPQPQADVPIWQQQKPGDLPGASVVPPLPPPTTPTMLKAPENESARDPSGLLKAQYQMKAQTLDPNKYRFQAEGSGYDAFKQRALQQGPSAWAQMQLKQQGLEESQGAGMAARQAAGGLAQARSGLAMRGGLGTGAQRSLAKSSMMSRNRALQANTLAGQQARLGVGMEDERQRLNLLSQLPQAELARNQFGQAQNQFLAGLESGNVDRQNAAGQMNVQNALRDIEAQNVGKYRNYSEEMKRYGAEQTANAMGQQPQQGFISNIFSKIF